MADNLMEILEGNHKPHRNHLKTRLFMSEARLRYLYHRYEVVVAQDYDAQSLPDLSRVPEEVLAEEVEQTIL